MQWVPVRHIRNGMRLAKSILLSDGRLFLIKGAELRETYIKPLQDQGVISVYVVNELAPDLVVEDIVPDELRRSVGDELKGVLRQVAPAVNESTRKGLMRVSVGIDTDKLKAAVDKVVDHLLGNQTVVFNLKDLRNADDYTLGHSVNVCVLSALLANIQGYTAAEVRDLAMGALLHDVGKTLTPPQILGKPGRLTPEETAVMNQHTVDGWNILKGQRTIPYTSAIVALQHHERWQGGGYPAGLKENEIFRFSRVCAVADCFDAMTADRVYRPGMSSAQALEVMQSEMVGFFEPELLYNFTQCVAPYPMGSLISLTGGTKAVVVGVTRGRTYRPRVRVVLDPTGEPLSAPYEMDLSDHPQVQITGLVREGVPAFEPELLDSVG